MQGVWGFYRLFWVCFLSGRKYKTRNCFRFIYGHIATATESDLAAPNFDPTCIGAVVSAVISTSGRETTSGWVSGSGFWWNFGSPVRATEVPWSWWFLRNLRRQNVSPRASALALGRRYGNQLTSGLLATYVTLIVRIRFHFRSVTRTAV